MAQDEITFKVNADAAKASLRSLDSTLQSTGKSIDGVKNTLEKVFAVQAIYASASRVADVIERVTDTLNAQTEAMQAVIQANIGGAKSFDQLASSAARAREEAKKITETAGKYEPILKGAENVLSVSKYTPVGAIMSKIAGFAREELDAQKEVAEGLNREAQLAEKKLQAQKQSVENQKQEAAMLEKQNRFLDYASKKYAERHGLKFMREVSATGGPVDMAAAFQAASVRDISGRAGTNFAGAFANAQGGIRGGMRGRGVGRFDAALADAEARRQAEGDQARAALEALAQTAPGQRTGGAREARRAQSLTERAAQAAAVGSTFDAAGLSRRAQAAEARALDRIDRNEARSARQEAFKIRQGMGLTGRDEALAKAKELEKKADELMKPGSSKRATPPGEKSLTDVFKILDQRLPSETS